jgi:excisionase family DNA binding protein
MSVTAPTETSPEVADIRATLMADLATPAEIAKALGYSQRTIFRMIGDGLLPIVRVGAKKFVVISTARAMMMATAAATRHQSVHRGRPRKKVA